MSRPLQLPSWNPRVMAAVAFVCVLLLGAAGALAGGARAGTTDLDDLRVGDCFTTEDELKQYQTEGPAAETVDVVPCEQSHEGEVFAVATLPDGPYPGDKKIRSTIDKTCSDKAVTDYLDPSAKVSKTVNVYDYFPDADSWAYGYRDIVCFLGDSSGPSTGSFGKG